MTAHQVYDAIMRSADIQIRSTEDAAEILDAGLERQLRSLIVQIAGNAANPISVLMEDELLGILDREASR